MDTKKILAPFNVAPIIVFSDKNGLPFTCDDNPLKVIIETWREDRWI